MEDINAVRGLTADIIAAYVQNNLTAPDALPGLIEATFETLQGLGEPKPVVHAKYEPVVSAKASVKPERVICMECGWSGKMLKRHLQGKHGLTPKEYRKRYHLSDTHPLIAPNYAEIRSALALKIGLGRKPKGGK